MTKPTCLTLFDLCCSRFVASTLTTKALVFEAPKALLSFGVHARGLTMLKLISKVVMTLAFLIAWGVLCLVGLYLAFKAVVLLWECLIAPVWTFFWNNSSGSYVSSGRRYNNAGGAALTLVLALAVTIFTGIFVCSCTPAARSSRTQGERQPLAWQRAPPFFCQQILQRCIVEHGVRQEFLQPGVLALQTPQPLGFGGLPGHRIWPSRL
jgi:hypothetical protein